MHCIVLTNRQRLLFSQAAHYACIAGSPVVPFPPEPVWVARGYPSLCLHVAGIGCMLPAHCNAVFYLSHGASFSALRKVQILDKCVLKLGRIWNALEMAHHKFMTPHRIEQCNVINNLQIICRYAINCTVYTIHLKHISCPVQHCNSIRSWTLKGASNANLVSPLPIFRNTLWMYQHSKVIILVMHVAKDIPSWEPMNEGCAARWYTTTNVTDRNACQYCVYITVYPYTVLHCTSIWAASESTFASKLSGDKPIAVIGFVSTTRSV